jgi:RNA polymerase sigma-70 factor, ECF subfamily
MTADLVRQAQRGDQVAFGTIIGAAYDRLYAIAYRILRDRMAAEDATQDAIVRCWRDLRGLREPDRFDAWLHRLLVNSCRDLARRNQRRPREVVGTVLDAPAVGDEYGRLADHDELERAFLGLPADQRIALVLTHYVGYSAPELAVILDVPTGTVYSRLHYGARAMREALAGSPPPPTAASEPLR